MSRILIAFTALLLTTATSVAAGPFEEGVRAYERERYSRALDLFVEAGEAGEAEAQFLLGKMYLDGRGTDVDPGAAVLWLERAVANSHREAALLLGKVYGSGLGVPLDPARAGEFLERAAELADEEDDEEDCE